MYNSDFLSQLGCQLPIIQAPMAGAQDSRLAIAVCHAGGLGSLPCAMLSIEQIEREIVYIRANTASPFNVNFFAHHQVDYTPEMQNRWLQVLQPYYQQFGLSEQDICHTGGRQPFNQATADLLADLKVPLVSFHFGLPEDKLLQQIKASGAKVISTATTLTEARWLQAKGVDAIIAQGLEAGGHRGMFLHNDIATQSGTFALLPNLVKAIDLPVIAAGGISDAATSQCTFSLGADAVQAGTAFLLADEAKTKAGHKTALQSSKASDTRLTNIFSGGIARGIATPFIESLGIHPAVPPFPHAAFVTDPIKNRAEQLGNNDFSAMWAGQNACLAVPGSAKAIIERILPSAV